MMSFPHPWQHVVDLSNSFVDDVQPKDPLTGHFLRNVSYQVPKQRGEWKDAQPMVVAKLVVRVDDVDGAPLVRDASCRVSRNALPCTRAALRPSSTPMPAH